MNLRVMVVDDSALYRQLIKNVLKDIVGVEVVGVAKSGKEALSLLTELDPQLLTLDVQMPDMNGLELLRQLKMRRSPVKAIMLSSLTAEGTQVTTDALLSGAFDFIQKPNSPDAGSNRDALTQALTEKVNAFRASIQSKLGTKQTTRKSTGNSIATADESARRPHSIGAPSIISPSGKPSNSTQSGAVKAVLIGTSTGGPVALREVLPKLPSNLGVPVFVVQHMPARYTKSLADRICEVSQMPVIEAADGMLVQSNRIYLAAGGLHMRLSARSRGEVVIETTTDPPEHNCRPAVDYTLRSAVDVYGGHLLAVILTGMGRDGTEGCRLIRARGGQVIAQHPEGCTVYGMPKAVIEEQLADRVAPLEKIASWIVRMLEART